MLDYERTGGHEIGSRLIASRQLAWRFLFLFVIVTLPAAGQEAASQIRSEIQRVQHSLKNRPVADPDFPNISTVIEDQLKSASAALDAGWMYLSLEKLGQAVDLVEGVRAVADKKAEMVKDGLPAYEAEWKKVSLSLNKWERDLRGRDWSHAPAAVRALSETSDAMAVPLMDGARGFVTAMQPKDGLFNLGQAQGEAEFAQFCASLCFAQKADAIPRRSLLPELQNLQDKTNAAFVPPRSIELHARFVQLNSTLKLAQDLDAARLYSGALYQYLKAVLHFGLLTAAPPDGQGQSALKVAIARAQKKLEASGRDDSIAQLCVEWAASLVAHAGNGAPSADDWTTAQVIIDQVLPAYFTTFEPISPLQQASGKTVDITLVRWPYT
jgi:hypothetical protein